MIAVPRIPEVQDGQILSTNLVNHIIKRTEYAADLLGQYKLITGDNTSLKQQFEGTRVNAKLSSKFRIVGIYRIGGVQRGFVYDGSTYTDIMVPGSSLTQAYGIDGNNIVGTYVKPS